ncbi:hypothetical protein QTP88_009321 [Uroleucon formosanum]
MNLSEISHFLERRLKECWGPMHPSKDCIFKYSLNDPKITFCKKNKNIYHLQAHACGGGRELYNIIISKKKKKVDKNLVINTYN